MKSFMENMYGTNSGMTPLECMGAVSQHRFNEELAKSPGPWLYTIYDKDDVDKKASLGTLSFSGNDVGVTMQWAQQNGGQWWDYNAVVTYGPYKND